MELSLLLLAGIATLIFVGFNIGGSSTGVARGPAVGIGKTVTTRRVCTEFASRTDEFAFEYVNLIEFRTQFRMAGEIDLVLTGEKPKDYEGLVTQSNPTEDPDDRCLSSLRTHISSIIETES